MYLLFWLVSPFHEKAKRWIQGRKDLFTALEASISKKTKKRIWLHCASLGEFEQAKPIVERWLESNNNWSLYVTFFSPSGFEARKDYSKAEWVGYFPLDTPQNAFKFLDIVQPDMVLFVKYEFWYFHLKEVIKRKIPLYLLSATFRESHFIFKAFGLKTRNILKQFTQLFVQDEHSMELLDANGFNNVTVSGDSRFDRVSQIAGGENVLPEIEDWKGQSKVLILGSSWKEEEELVANYLKEQGSLNNWKVLIAPHDIKEEHLETIEVLFSDFSCSRYSTMVKDSQVLIIDNIGMLSRLYSYADIAVVGGGFGRGLHNILEPLSHGVYTCFGPVHNKFPEAKEALNAGVAIALAADVKLLDISYDPKMVKSFVQSRKGATILVTDFLEKKINEKI